MNAGPAMEFHAYLAGPDVFLPDAVEIGRRKKALLADYGMIGHFPIDNEIAPEAMAQPQTAANAIGRANERMMLDCLSAGRFGIIFADMTPFRGPSMDVGTAFEVGFMSALAETHDNILVMGYTDDPRTFEERVVALTYGGALPLIGKDGRPYGADGIGIEAFGGAENLMITHAIEKTGGKICTDLRQAADFAARKLGLNIAC